MHASSHIVYTNMSCIPCCQIALGVRFSSTGSHWTMKRSLGLFWGFADRGVELWSRHQCRERLSRSMRVRHKSGSDLLLLSAKYGEGDCTEPRQQRLLEGIHTWAAAYIGIMEK